MTASIELPPFNHDLLPNIPEDSEVLADTNYGGLRDPLRAIVASADSPGLVDLFPEPPIETDNPGAEISAAFTTLVHMLLKWVNSGDEKRGPDQHSVQFDFSGEHGTVILVDGSRPVVVKTFPAYNEAARLEALVLGRLGQYKKQKQEDQDIQQQPSLKKPEYIRYEPHGEAMFQQLWMTRVGGEKLSNDRVHCFSNAEKNKLGEGVGREVAYIAGAVSCEQYESLRNKAGRPVLFDRENLIRDIANVRQLRDRRLLNVNDPDFTDFTPKSEMHPGLADALAWLKSEYKTLDARGLLHASMIVTHDDLRVANLSFSKDNNGEYAPYGLFDFGLTGVMDAERSLRHIVPFGEEATGPAMESYEKCTGQKLSRRALNMWAIGQIVTIAAVSDLSPNRLPRLRELMPELEALLPGRDWQSLVAPK